MKIVIWQKVLTFHVFYTWNSFEKLVNNKILHIVTGFESDVRRNQGWKFPDLGGYDVIKLNKFNWLINGIKILETNKDAIHIFFSFWGERKYFPLILYAAWRGIKVAVLNEPYSTSFTGYLKEDPFIISWAKAKLRPIIYRFFALSLKLISRDKPPCILAISLLARDQFIRAGFDEKTIFLFGHFVKKVSLKKDLKEMDQGNLRLVFVGGLLKRKGLDLLIESVETLSSSGIKVTLDIYGAGQPDKFVPQDSVCVHYQGILPQDDVQGAITQYDYLVLPSRHDGWGVVVNEALLQGVPVVVSDRVGAKCIVETSGAGFVFKSEDCNDLTDTLKKLVLTPNIIDDLRKQAAQVGKLILPEVAASYLYDVFNYYFQGSKGHRPDAIWCGGETAKRISNKDSLVDHQLG
ncbi:MAG: glycosyltransferase family 4 protein [Bacteroidetes bacterium]|nr:glycosyltransferase family 4 protein [Bacteroidota bacterium]